MEARNFLESMIWQQKSLLSIEGLSSEEILFILDKAKSLKESKGNEEPIFHSLRGKRIINLFMEPSTRTRVAFEIAAKSLGADTISISGEASSLTKGETLKDTAMNVQALGADAIVLRHSSPGSPLFLSRIVDVPIINAGDGAHEHPSQALLDIYTLREKLGDLRDRKITILGDILFSRVARSNLWGLLKLGAKVTLAGPSTLVPREFEKLGARVTHDPSVALKDADAVMLLRIQHERQQASHFPSLAEYANVFGLDSKVLSAMKRNAIILHPGPLNRGVEIESEVADSGRAVILQQVANGIAVRMAILHLCITSEKSSHS
jgi:aspartate carbamoyltransferase catalytic subunit|tara:strand:+ start:2158 stop:3120 length:963 start_codon:yes stop_codon:yes gene_type:complete